MDEYYHDPTSSFDDETTTSFDDETTTSFDDETTTSSSRLLDKEIIQRMKKVPCYNDFLRYIQWHNLAFTTTLNLSLPTLVIHYEDYEGDRFNDTLNSIMDFLSLEWKKKNAAEFIAGKTYQEDYFSRTQVRIVMEVMETLAVVDVWDMIKRYF
eukprot:6300657-Ditylum_brightwellii.AAC.1